jgi:membrane protease YdiL (CAAX protease family)
MVAYPAVSVYPQEVIYRAFVFHRYGPVFPGRWAIIAASAGAFALAHAPFGHWLSVVLSGAGGVIFAYTYQRTESLLAPAVEHALYGCFIFTVGLGTYFYYPGPAG